MGTDSPLLNDDFFAGLDRSILPLGEAETLPPECYTDADFYEFEKEAVFNHEWLCVGRESHVSKPGDFFTTSFIGEPIIVARTLEGELRAMSAVCQHRGMLVAEGYGSARGFVCPYHHWTYSLDGKLVNAPAMEKTCNFDKARIRLGALKTEVWLGFIFVNFDHGAPPLAPRLKAVEEAVEHYDMPGAEEVGRPKTFKFNWNWKVMFENNNDGYHANRLHGGPLHDFVPSRLASFPEVPPDSAGFLRHNRTLHPDASFNATQKAVLPIFPNLTAEDRHRMVFANIPPTLSLVMSSDMVIYLVVRATGAEIHEMDVGELVAPGAQGDPGFIHRLEMINSAAGKIMAQDQHVDELVQVGLRSRFAVRGRYSWQEGAQIDLNKWLVPRYQSCWKRQRAAVRN
ncbi:MAG: aromatic ring-hydroxylating dioxygenase subunit alpha [Gammaproteobacteria bacterium]|nr:aromatic ring-hydroxylating dioxygenase subunit alpha [Gammaproteobacteria bacterium]